MSYQSFTDVSVRLLKYRYVRKSKSHVSCPVFSGKQVVFLVEFDKALQCHVPIVHLTPSSHPGDVQEIPDGAKDEARFSGTGPG